MSAISASHMAPTVGAAGDH